jgi:hypothetical protein
VSRPTRGPLSRFPVRGCHPLWRAFPDASGTKDNGHWPVPRSLATTDGISRQLLSQPPSRAACATRVLMSVPPATEMFQFAGFASCTYEFSTGYPCGWVAPFGDPGITDRSHLPRAFRSVPRPSSPLSAKASTRCPCFALDHRIASPAMPHHRRAQGQTPCLAPHKRDVAASMKTLLSDKPGASSACATLGRQQSWRYADRRSFAPPIGDRRSAASPNGAKLCLHPALSASVTSQLSLHPSISRAAVARGGVAQSSPNIVPARATPGSRNTCREVATGLRAWWR